MEELVKGLNEAFDFPFFGCTGIGILSTGGYSQSSISLLVLTADDVEFSIGMPDMNLRIGLCILLIISKVILGGHSRSGSRDTG